MAASSAERLDPDAGASSLGISPSGLGGSDSFFPPSSLEGAASPPSFKLSVDGSSGASAFLFYIYKSTRSNMSISMVYNNFPLQIIIYKKRREEFHLCSSVVMRRNNMI